MPGGAGAGGGPRGNSVPGEVVGQSSLPSLAPPRNSVPPRPHRGFEPGPLDLELDANPTRLQALKALFFFRFALGIGGGVKVRGALLEHRTMAAFGLAS